VLPAWDGSKTAKAGRKNPALAEANWAIQAQIRPM
jgi:hypothetical protein